jgi:hypothetical protein
MLPLTETLITRFFTVTLTTGFAAEEVAEGLGVAFAVVVAEGVEVGLGVAAITVRVA